MPAESLFFPSFNVPPPFIEHFLISGTHVPGSSYVSLPLSWNHLFIHRGGASFRERQGLDT